LPLAPNLLRQHFSCEVPNRVWLADMSYLSTGEGFLYFAGMKDLCTKKIVGWSMSATILVHSDRGSPPRLGERYWRTRMRSSASSIEKRCGRN